MKNLKPKYEVEMIERGGKHIYILDGAELMSVSEIQSIIGGIKKVNLRDWQNREILKWVKDKLWECIKFKGRVGGEDIKDILNDAIWRPQSILETAGDIGDKVHKAIQCFILGIPHTVEEEAQIGFDNFVEWATGRRIIFHRTEVMVASKKYQYGGMLDADTEENKERILDDWKTSNQLRAETPIQLAGYNQAHFETYGWRFDKARCVRFGKNKRGDIEEKIVNLPKAFEGFKVALGMYNTMQLPLWK